MSATSSFRPAARVGLIQPSAIRQLYDRAPAGAINLGLGEPDYWPPELIRDAAIAAIRGDRNGYTPNAGLLDLRRKIAERQGAAWGPTNVCVTTGSQEALTCAILASVDPGDEVLVPDPGFLAYPTLVRLAGGVPVPYALRRDAGFVFDGDAFRAAITPRTRAALLNSPSNPTGATLTATDLDAVAAACAPDGIQVISDEIYRDLFYTADLPPSAADRVPGAIVVSGLSKSLGMTGWRLGWALGPSEAMAAITKLHQFLTTSASAVSQRAALAGFGPAAEDAIAGFRGLLRERRDALCELIEAELGLPFAAPQGAFYLFADVSRYGSSFAVAERLLEQGVITVPGAAFGQQGEGYLRLSFASDVGVLRAGVRRLERGLRALSA